MRIESRLLAAIFLLLFAIGLDLSPSSEKEWAGSDQAKSPSIQNFRPKI